MSLKVLTHRERPTGFALQATNFACKSFSFKRQLRRKAVVVLRLLEERRVATPVLVRFVRASVVLGSCASGYVAQLAAELAKLATVERPIADCDGCAWRVSLLCDLCWSSPAARSARPQTRRVLAAPDLAKLATVERAISG